jgi:hypothetical protein
MIFYDRQINPMHAIGNTVLHYSSEFLYRWATLQAPKSCKHAAPKALKALPRDFLYRSVQRATLRASKVVVDLMITVLFVTIRSSKHYRCNVVVSREL